MNNELNHSPEEPNPSSNEAKLLDELGLFGKARRTFIRQLSAAGLSVWALQLTNSQESLAAGSDVSSPSLWDALENVVRVRLRINGQNQPLEIDSRMTLLDTLRERLLLTGTKKGCDHGQCGACTVLIEGRRVLSCLTLAATCKGRSITTIEGLTTDKSVGGRLHPMQEAFIKYDGFQCGYCTPGQICSAVALLEEAKRGEASYITRDVRVAHPNQHLSDEEIRERMSGNICRCGAYPNILAAIREVQTGGRSSPLWEFYGGGQADPNTTPSL